jgi:hypothetical protein
MQPFRTTLRNTRAILDWRIEPVDLDADWPQIDRLLRDEQWPFTRDDIALSVEHPDTVALAARKEGELLGFILAHRFGPVAYYDMTVVQRAHRLARPALVAHLWLQADDALAARGLRSAVSHGTRTGARGLRMMGFRPGREFTALRREPAPGGARDPRVRALEARDLDALTALDEAVFGLRRAHWVRALFAAGNARHAGVDGDGALAASICLRERRDGVLYLDACNALSFDALRPLVDHLVAAHGDGVLECMVAVDTDLHRHLLAHGFFVPAAFAEIAPLVEFARGDTADIGRSGQVRTLNWF